MPYLVTAGARRTSRIQLTHIVFIAACVVASACGDQPIAEPRTHGKIAISSGNAQRGSPGEALDRPIVLVVRDASGAPVANVRVAWFADDGGAIAPAESVTDADGAAQATWTLGDASVHRGHAKASGYADAVFTASTDVSAELPLDVIQPLGLATYDGSGQTVHPDYVATGAEWAGSADQYLLITPYPNGNANFENPSILERVRSLDWAVPAGVVNPIAAPGDGYLSDPDALYVPDHNEIWLYFRQVTSENVIRLTTSRDGVRWSAPVVVARAPNHQIISPTVVRRSAADWLMWSVNGNSGCTGATAAVELRRSSNGTDWSAPQTVDLAQPGLFPWHIDVEWIASRGEYWALYNAKTPGACTTGAVYLATSTDGVHWKTYPSPVLAHGAIPELQDVVYRSSFTYDESADAITFWYSGARLEGASYLWHSAVQRRLRPDVFATINVPVAPRSGLALERPLPQLLNFP
jgi:hypothetical protein